MIVAAALSPLVLEDNFMKISHIAIAAALFSPSVIHAEEAEENDRIIVTGTIESRALSELESPALGVGIDEEQIAAVNAINTEDVVRYAPNVIVRKRYIGDANATLSIRNMHTQQTPRALVTIDGFVISDFLGASFDTAPKWAVIAPSDVAHAEIIYGPTSARYSGHSLGGTLRLNTREITQNRIHASLQGTYQTYKYYQTNEDLYGWSGDVGVDFALGDRGGLSINYRHFENEGQPMQWRRVSGSSLYASQGQRDEQLGFLNIAAQDSVIDSKEDQLRLRGNYDLGGDWEGRILLGLLFDKEDTTNPKSFLVDDAGQPTFIGISGIRQGLSQSTELLAGLGLSGPIGGWDVDLAFSRFDLLDDEDRRSDNYDTATGLAPLTGSQTTSDAYWNSLEALAERTMGQHALALGLSYARYKDESITHLTSDWRAGTVTGVRDASGGTTQLLGVFAEDAVELTPTLTATLGLRYEDWQASGGYLTNGGTHVDYASRSDNAWSPKAALTLRPDAQSELTLSVSRAVRFPTVRELYQAGLIAYGPNAGQLDLNGFNPELTPERGWDYQLTASRRFGNVKLTLSGYRQDVTDAIFSQSIAIPDPLDPDVLATSSLRTNIDNVRSYGADFIIAAEDIFIPGLSLDANASWNKTKVRANALNRALEGNLWPRVPKWRINASLRYKPSEDWLLAANFRHQSTPDRNIENSSSSRCDTFFCVSPFSFIDLKVTKKFGDFAVSAGVDNLLDEKAFVFHPYPGRSFQIRLDWDGLF